MPNKKTRPEGKKDLKEAIRGKLKEFNEDLKQAYSGGNWNSQLEAVRERLIRYGGTGRRAKGGLVLPGLGFKGKEESELLRQYTEITRAMRADIWTPAAAAREEERQETQYASFKKTRPDWTRKEWLEFVELLGTTSTELLRSFGYEYVEPKKGSRTKKVSTVPNESFVKLFHSTYKVDIDLLSVMEDVNKKLKGTGNGTEVAIDYLKEEIKRIAKEKGKDDMLNDTL